MYHISCFYHKMHDSSQNCYISTPLIGNMMQSVLGYILRGLGQRSSNEYFVNVSPPKPLNVATSNFLLFVCLI